MGLRLTEWYENPAKYCVAADWESACRHAQRIFDGSPWAFD
jgi:hypothetical protein